MKVSKFQGLLVMLGECHRMSEAYKNEGDANFAQVSGLIRQAVGKIDATSALALGNDAKADAPKRATFNTTPPPYKGSAQKAKGGKPAALPTENVESLAGEGEQEEVVAPEIGLDSDPTILRLRELADAKAVVAEFSVDTLRLVAEKYGIVIPEESKNAMQVAARVKNWLKENKPQSVTPAIEG